jgi:nucleotide-binding universal stress UspA family protein
MQIESIIVGVDFCGHTQEAIRQAHAWALLYRARLIACCILPPIVRELPLSGRPSADGHDAQLAAASPMLSTHVRRVTGRSASDLTVLVTRGSVHTELLRCAEEQRADLIVLGSRVRNPKRKILMAGTMEHVIRGAQCPVLIARRSPDSRQILAATDLSDPELPAIKAAASHARRRSAELSVLYCPELRATSSISAQRGAGVVPLAEAEAALRDAVERAGVEADRIVEHGRARAVIVREARDLEAELMVVGTSRATGARRLILGDVAESVLRIAPCSTLVVRLSHERRTEKERATVEEVIL